MCLCNITIPFVINLITSMYFKHMVGAEKESASLVSQNAVQVSVTNALCVATCSLNFITLC